MKFHLLCFFIVTVLAAVTVKAASPVCVDEPNNNCVQLARLGYCDTNKPFMWGRCKQSCQMCHCVDTLLHCSYYAETEKLCHTTRTVAEQCRYSCQNCHQNITQVVNDIKRKKNEQDQKVLDFDFLLHSSQCVTDKEAKKSKDKTFVDTQCLFLKPRLDCINAVPREKEIKAIVRKNLDSGYKKKKCSDLIDFEKNVKDCHQNKTLSGDCGSSLALVKCAEPAYIKKASEERHLILKWYQRSHDTCLRELVLLRQHWHDCMARPMDHSCNNVLKCYDESATRKDDKAVVNDYRTDIYKKTYEDCKKTKDTEDFRKDWNKCIKDATNDGCTNIEVCFKRTELSSSLTYTNPATMATLKVEQITKSFTCERLDALKEEWNKCMKTAKNCSDVIGCFLEADSQSNITNVKTIQHPKEFTICRDKAELALLRKEWHTCMVQHNNNDCRYIMTCYDDASEKKKEEVKDVVTFDRTQEYYKKYLQCQNQRDIEDFRKEWKDCMQKDCTKVENCFNEAKRHSRITNGNHATFNMLKADMEAQKTACKNKGK